MPDATAFEKTIAGRADALALDAIRKSGKTAIYTLTPQQQGEWWAAVRPVQKQMEDGAAHRQGSAGGDRQGSGADPAWTMAKVGDKVSVLFVDKLYTCALPFERAFAK